MKHYILILALLLSTVSSYAAKLVVEAGGSGGAYTTIQAAIDAAVPGDQIYVYPGIYNGFEIHTGNISIVSAEAGQRYTVNSYINIFDHTGPVHISNLELMNANLVTYEDCASPQTTRITDSKFNTASAYNTDYRNHIFHVQNCIFENGNTSISHGSVSGCTFTGYCGLNLHDYSSGGITGDTVRVIGNYFNSNQPGYGVMYITSPTSLLYAEGNFFNNGSNYPEMQFYNTYASAGTGNTIINNTFNYSLGAGYLKNYIRANYELPVNNMSKIIIRNNVFAGVHAPSADIYNSGPTNPMPAGTEISYNVFTQAPADAIGTGFTDGGNNIFSASPAINPATGQVTSADGIDDGDPNPAFYDLDKTRNDMGCYGGSYSRANFDQADNGSRVLMLTAPRVVLSGNSVNIKGDGLAK